MTTSERGGPTTPPELHSDDSACAPVPPQLAQLFGRDPRHQTSAAATLWTTVNAGEAMPGVITPLGWSIWGPSCDGGLRKAFRAFGALTVAEAAGPANEQDRIVGVFYGRVALRADFFLTMGERLPGTSGAKAAEGLFDAVPEGYVSHPERRFYPGAAVRIPRLMLSSPRLLLQARAETEPWWRTELVRLATADAEDARRSLLSAIERFSANSFLHMLVTFTAVQPAYDQLSALVQTAGVGSGLLSGGGDHEETRMVHDLWACSRGRLDLDAFLARHGYHGPNEGEVSGRVWREDAVPLKRILEGYRSLGDDGDPRRREEAFARSREREKRDLLGSLGFGGRARARAVFAFADRRLPLRGVGKTAFLLSLDVARASARRLGGLLADDGIFERPEDIFFLTRDEIDEADWSNARDLVTERRGCHEEFDRLGLPVSWRGMPEPHRLDDRDDAVDVLTGVGASAGVVEGPARVVTDPADIELEPGEILVAHATDPSWATIMFLSSGLVIDIGGMLSHAAIVARELGVPCVANTRVGTRVLNTGDRCRVDGSTGRVEILERAGS